MAFPPCGEPSVDHFPAGQAFGPAAVFGQREVEGDGDVVYVATEERPIVP